MQPEFFPDPHSKAPALNPSITIQPLCGEPTTKVKSESQAKNRHPIRVPPIPTGRSRHLQIETLRTPQEGSSVVENTVDMDWSRKRIASAELKPNVKHVKVEEVDQAMPIRKTKTKSSEKKSPRILQFKPVCGGVPGVSDFDTVHRFLSISLGSGSGDVNGSSKIDRFEEDLSDSKLNQGSSKRSSKAVSFSAKDIQTKARKEPCVSSKGENIKDKQVGDLIDFSDSEIMDTGNLVIGKETPPIAFTKSNKALNTAKGSAKSGVDIFLEERGREERISALECSTTQLGEKLKLNTTNCFRHSMQLEKHDHSISNMQSNMDRVERVESKVLAIATLEEKFKSLEHEVIKLRTQLGRAMREISTHEDMFVRLMEPAEVETSSEDDDSNANES
ncbi:uncharacterized protein MELLADRAFT_91921 [Melampsora larici-populina 98AG31]|uniref:Uncharacterized protein n=1 Tax=Melampsora larici-populina (strain 98AG31 / pathotype 3-4-7) TaxID=747676 RepID=F4S0W3_MELLP|nr:uncharacterized protein MELLADRAFT_91921 [Melampsora larici-populina 98AG31]EGG01740.1 hypothetical protein MELLADRAFT_91921 [Melampsora larici-populina 98AG31]